MDLITGLQNTNISFFELLVGGVVFYFLYKLARFLHLNTLFGLIVKGVASESASGDANKDGFLTKADKTLSKLKTIVKFNDNGSEGGDKFKSYNDKGIRFDLPKSWKVKENYSITDGLSGVSVEFSIYARLMIVTGRQSENYSLDNAYRDISKHLFDELKGNYLSELRNYTEQYNLDVKPAEEIDKAFIHCYSEMFSALVVDAIIGTLDDSIDIDPKRDMALELLVRLGKYYVSCIKKGCKRDDVEVSIQTFMQVSLDNIGKKLSQEASAKVLEEIPIEVSGMLPQSVHKTSQNIIKGFVQELGSTVLEELVENVLKEVAGEYIQEFVEGLFHRITKRFGDNFSGKFARLFVQKLTPEVIDELIQSSMEVEIGESEFSDISNTENNEEITERFSYAYPLLSENDLDNGALFVRTYKRLSIGDDVVFIITQMKDSAHEKITEGVNQILSTFSYQES